MIDNNQVKIYEASIGWKIFFVIVAAPMATGCIWLILLIFQKQKGQNILLAVAIGLFFSVFALGCIFAIIQVFKIKLEIYTDRIRIVGVVQVRELYFKDIRGYKSEFYTTLIPKNSYEKNFAVPDVIEKQSEISLWVQQNFENLTQEEYQKEKKEILTGGKDTESTEDRELLLLKAKGWGKFLNYITVVCCIWAIFWPKFYLLMTCFLLCIPVVAICSTAFFDGLLRFDSKETSLYPNIALAFFMPPFALALRALLDWNLLSVHDLWLPSLAVASVLFILLLSFTEELRDSIGTAIFVFCLCCAYSGSAITLLNGTLDKKKAKKYQSKITHKKKSSGDYTRYYFKLTPWGPNKQKKKVNVKRSIYRQKSVGDTVTIYVKPGKFKIPWYYVE